MLSDDCIGELDRLLDQFGERMDRHENEMESVQHGFTDNLNDQNFILSQMLCTV